MHSPIFPRWAAVVAVLGTGLVLSACGGGSASSDPTPPASTLSLNGVAATGAAMANATVQVKCVGANGTTTTGADGSYSLKLVGAALPCALRAATADGNKLHTFAQGTGLELVANITPLTEMLMTRAAHQAAGSFFDAFAAASAKEITLDMLRTAQGEVKVLLNGTVDTTAVPDFNSSPLKAATPGQINTDTYDKILDTLAQRVTPTRFGELLRALASSGPLPDPIAFVPKLTLRDPSITLAVGQSAILVADLNYPPNVRYLRPPMNWVVVEADGGSVTTDGNYTAPTKAGTYHVKASRDDFVNVSATMTITVTAFVPSLTVAPADYNVALMPGQTHHFRADINYPPGINYVRQPTSWKVVEADGGTISIEGAYVAPAKTGTYHVTVTRDDFKDKSITLEVKVGSYQNLPLTRLPLSVDGSVVMVGDPPEQVLIRDASAWLAWEKSHPQLRVSDLPASGVDFERFMLVYVDLGARSPCFSNSRVLDVAPVGGKLQVSIQDTPFGSDMACIQAVLPGPNWLLMVPKSDLPLSVVVRP